MGYPTLLVSTVNINLLWLTAWHVMETQAMTLDAADRVCPLFSKDGHLLHLISANFNALAAIMSNPKVVTVLIFNPLGLQQSPAAEISDLRNAIRQTYREYLLHFEKNKGE